MRRVARSNAPRSRTVGAAICRSRTPWDLPRQNDPPDASVQQHHGGVGRHHDAQAFLLDALLDLGERFDVALRLPRERVLRLGQEKAYALVADAAATQEPDVPAELARIDAKVGGIVNSTRMKPRLHPGGSGDEAGARNSNAPITGAFRWLRGGRYAGWSTRSGSRLPGR